MRAPHEVLGVAKNATKEEALEAYRRKAIYMNPTNFEVGSGERRQAEANAVELLEALDAFSSQAMPPKTMPLAGEEKNLNRLTALGYLSPTESTIPVSSCTDYRFTQNSGYPRYHRYKLSAFGCFAQISILLLFLPILFYGKLDWFIFALSLFLIMSWIVMGYSLRRGNTLMDIICVILLGVGGHMLCSHPFGIFIAGSSLSIIFMKTHENPYMASIAARHFHGFFGVTSIALMFIGVICAVYQNFIR